MAINGIIYLYCSLSQGEWNTTSALQEKDQPGMRGLRHINANCVGGMHYAYAYSSVKTH